MEHGARDREELLIRRDPELHRQPARSSSPFSSLIGALFSARLAGNVVNE